jgi:hypothetical protein
MEVPNKNHSKPFYIRGGGPLLKRIIMFLVNVQGRKMRDLLKDSECKST